MKIQIKFFIGFFCIVLLIITPLVVFLVSQTDDVFSSKETYFFIGYLVLSLIAITVLSTSYFRQIVYGRLERVVEGLKVVRDGDFKYRLSESGNNDELGVLIRGFNSMAESLEELFGSVEKGVSEKTKDVDEKEKKLEKQQDTLLELLKDVETEKKRANDLVDELNKFKLAVDHSSNHIVITDIDGIVLYANHAVEKITGFSSEEIIGKDINDKDIGGGLMEASFYEQLWNTLKVDKQSFSGDINRKRKNGEVYLSHAFVSPIIDKSGLVRFIVWIERDITQEKQVDKAKTEFVSLASHQLRTPLTAIGWNTELLLSGDAGKITKKQKEYLEQIYAGNKRMVSLVNDLLNVSRLELGTFSVQPEKMSLHEMIDSVLDELKPKIMERKIILKKDLDKVIDTYSGDPTLLRIVVQNLLSNSVKYNKEGGELAVMLCQEGSDLIFSVADQGIGIPHTQQDKVFGRLFRADNATESQIEGNGLGLYIVKSIVEGSNGKVWFESLEGKGTTFFVRLPLSGMIERKGSKMLNT